MVDFCDRIRDLEISRNATDATRLIDEMVSGPWKSLSKRDSIEFFNELLSLEQMFPDLVRHRGAAVLAKIQSDTVRGGLRQDQISKAELLNRFGQDCAPPLLLQIAEDQSQDLDTRNAAVLQTWQAAAVDDTVAVRVVRSLLTELLDQCSNGEDTPAANFAIGLAYRLLQFSRRTTDDDSLIARVYRYHNPAEPEAQWFRIQSTIAGLLSEPRERG